MLGEWGHARGPTTAKWHKQSEQVAKQPLIAYFRVFHIKNDPLHHFLRSLCPGLFSLSPFLTFLIPSHTSLDGEDLQAKDIEDLKVAHIAEVSKITKELKEVQPTQQDELKKLEVHHQVLLHMTAITNTKIMNLTWIGVPFSIIVSVIPVL